MSVLVRVLALAAPVLALAGGVLAQALWPQFSHLQHPLPLPGAGGLRLAAVYNALVFIAPGLLGALLAWAFYEDLNDEAGWRVRIGSRLLLIAGLALAAQGVWSLDLHDLDGPEGGRHAAAWLVWWLAAASGLLLVGTGPVGREPAGAVHWRWPAWLAAVVLAALSSWPQWPWPEALNQRLALTVWFAWWVGWALRLRARRAGVADG